MLVGRRIYFCRLLELLSFLVKNGSIHKFNDDLRLYLFIIFSIGSILIDQRVQDAVVLCNESHSLIIQLYEEGIGLGCCEELQRNEGYICNLDFFSKVSVKLERAGLEEMDQTRLFGVS